MRVQILYMYTIFSNVFIYHRYGNFVFSPNIHISLQINHACIFLINKVYLGIILDGYQIKYLLKLQNLLIFDKNCLRYISASIFLKTVRIIKKPIKTDKYESIKYYYLLEFQLLLLQINDHCYNLLSFQINKSYLHNHIALTLSI